MPATRLRNLDWQRSLRQVLERGGSLDIAVAGNSEGDTSHGVNVLWRVRLLGVDDDAIVVEQPVALGAPVELGAGVELAVILAIGQNRWMFRSSIIEAGHAREGGLSFSSRAMPCLRLSMPQAVERCQRRSNYRVSTTAVNLPQVNIWPLLDPKTVIVAERANEIEHQSGGDDRAGAAGGFKGTGDSEGAGFSNDQLQLRLPEVGPGFTARLLNLGGGGAGLAIDNAHSGALLRHKVFWLRFALPPHLAAPICATAKIVHTHMTASQEYYAGLAFDFTFNPAHQKFVVEQIGRYVAEAQRTQLLRKAG